MQVIAETDRASPWPGRASPSRAPQPRQQLLHRRSRPAAAPGVLDEQRRHPLSIAHTLVVVTSHKLSRRNRYTSLLSLLGAIPMLQL
jgi:hypothetical protein